MNVRIFQMTPQQRQHRNCGSYVTLHVEPYDSPAFYHQATAARLRWSYRYLRRLGIDAGTARQTVADVLFAANMAKSITFTSGLEAVTVAS